MEASTLPNTIKSLETNIQKIIKGKPEVVRAALVALIANGHLLIEDVPGVGKTTLANTLARTTALSFRRIQFTSDLLPSDILGVSVLDPNSGEFKFKPGPIFSNILLADEINRATPKTQSALLEAMNESKVTLDGKTYLLPQPFLVIATQNPYEYRGTFPLPESQLDRFAMRISIGYPDHESEKEILMSPDSLTQLEKMKPIISKEKLIALQKMVSTVTIDESILDYIIRISNETRNPKYFELGVSPRGTLALKRAAQARALVEGRQYCIPDDIKALVIPVLSHRIVTKHSRINGAGREEEALMEALERVDIPI